jgi:hypothetical protein
VDGDYSRKTGLVGDGSSKYLNSNRNNNADPKDNTHHAAYVSTVGTGSVINCAGAFGVTGQNGITAFTFRANNGPGAINYTRTTGFLGVSRNNSAFFFGRNNNATTQQNTASQTPVNENTGIFAQSNGSNHDSCRLAFYSIGESLDLALLDARVTDLINAFGAAIP